MSNKVFTVKKVRKGGNSDVIHHFKDDFVNELSKEDFKIVCDFFSIWNTNRKNHFGLNVHVTFNNDLIDMEDNLEKSNKWVNGLNVFEYKAFTIIVDGLSKSLSIRDPVELLKIMKVSYKPFIDEKINIDIGG